MSDYICRDCGRKFDEPTYLYDNHGDGMYEQLTGCPGCYSTDFDEAVVCEECGEVIAKSDAQDGLCRKCYEDREKENENGLNANW